MQFSTAPQFPTPPVGNADTSGATTAFVSQAVAALQAQVSNVTKIYYLSGEVLPTADRGPIWHADYNGWMTWQSFTANGANYIGYASVGIGMLVGDSQPSVRSGFLASGSLSLSRTTYASLRAWAMHVGIYVPLGSWQSGSIMCADNADGTTFRIYDVRAEFPRYWDNGRGVDAGRGFNVWQASQMQSHSHRVSTQAGTNAGVNLAQTDRGFWNYADPRSTEETGGTSNGSENRPRNFPVFPAVKF